MRKVGSQIPLFSCVAAAALCVVPQAAYAEGVAAGTPIENTAQATFTIGTETQTVPSNTVIVTVDEILDVAVTSLDGGNVPLSNDGAVLSFLVTNSGNGPEAYEITIDAALTDDEFDPEIIKIAYDSNGSGAYEEGEDELLPVDGVIPEILADGVLQIFVIGALGDDPDDGQTADVRLTATATTGTGAAGTVFAGEGVGGSDAVVGTTTALSDSDGTYIVAISAVSLDQSRPDC